MANPRSRPGPRYAATLVRLALSNEALNTSGTANSAAICFKPRGDRERQLLALDHARPGNDQQRLAAAAAKISDGDGVFGHGREMMKYEC